MAKPTTLANRMWLRLQPPCWNIYAGSFDPWRVCPLYMLRQDRFTDEQYKGYCDMLLRVESDFKPHPLSVGIGFWNTYRITYNVSCNGWDTLDLANIRIES